MASDTYGMGIPLPADSTPIYLYPAVAREMGERVAQILAGGIMPEGMAAVAGEAVAAALQNTNLATSKTFLATDDDEGFIGDAQGKPSRVGFDKYGEIATATILSAHGKGVPLAFPGAGGLRIQDENGRQSWLGWDKTGAPDEIAKQALINTLHAYTGPDRPFVWPGNYVVWTRTDETGTPLDTLIGRN